MKTETRSRPREVSIEAVVIRADGTKQNLGTIAYWHRNPLMRLLWRAKQTLQKRQFTPTGG